MIWQVSSSEPLVEYLTGGVAQNRKDGLLWINEEGIPSKNWPLSENMNPLCYLKFSKGKVIGVYSQMHESLKSEN